MKEVRCCVCLKRTYIHYKTIFGGYTCSERCLEKFQSLSYEEGNNLHELIYGGKREET